jgi:hypothetical protein
MRYLLIHTFCYESLLHNTIEEVSRPKPSGKGGLFKHPLPPVPFLALARNAKPRAPAEIDAFRQPSIVPV